jgi:hypothetical protein
MRSNAMFCTNCLGLLITSEILWQVDTERTIATFDSNRDLQQQHISVSTRELKGSFIFLFLYLIPGRRYNLDQSLLLTWRADDPIRRPRAAF